MSNKHRQKTVILVGGGSGGHLTPLVSVAHALKEREPNVFTVFIGQIGENLHEIVHTSAIDDHTAIHAGKFRRYHGESFLQHMLDVKTILLNVRDFFRFLQGSIEAWRLIGRYKPDAIFLKGGFVSVPVGFAARLRHVPYITHDSDAVPGLANRLTAKHARWNTTALPAAIYPYDQKKCRHVGIPIQTDYSLVTDDAIKEARQRLGIPENAQLLVSVGGGLGARVMNHALVNVSKELLQDKQRHIIHFTGKKLYEETIMLYNKQSLTEHMQDRLHVIDFTNELYTYTAAADVVMSRAGATNIAELSAQGKLCIIIPAPHLTGGQQLHNAAILQKRKAAIIVHEKELSALAHHIEEVSNMKESDKQTMKGRLHQLFVPYAAEKIASILLTL
jgi:UDP-N-acetylglucosamine--N-acetylmuramyl-(pentapeptide) pyrophosphoryl-undecaprenol N-acetylglucosamine transferase